MAQIAKPAAEKAAATTKDAANNVTDHGQHATDKAAELTRETVAKSKDTARGGLSAVQRTAGTALEAERAVVRRSAEGTAELGQALTDLLKEQTQQNLKTMMALTGAVDWDQVARAIDWEQVLRIQSEYLRDSLERMGRIKQCYLEVSQAVLTTSMTTAVRQTSKAF